MDNRERAIDCKVVHESLAAYLDDKMTPDEREAIETHLSACRQCSEDLDAAAGIHDRIIKASDSLSNSITPSPDIWLGVRRRLAAEEHNTRISRWLAGAKSIFGKETAMKTLLLKQPVWRVAAVCCLFMAALVSGLVIGLPSSTAQIAYTQVEDIARDSKEVQDALGGNVSYADTVSLEGNSGIAMCFGVNGSLAAVSVDLGNRSVTNMSLIELTADEKQQAVDIAMNDSRIADLVQSDAVMSEVSPDYNLGNGVDAGDTSPDIVITAKMSLQTDEKLWYVTIDLDEGIVQDFYEAPGFFISRSLISPEQVRQAVRIARADPRVAELLDQGAVITVACQGLEVDGKVVKADLRIVHGDRLWGVVVDLVKEEVFSMWEDPFGNISVDELESYFASGYALNPLEVRDVLDIVDSDQDLAALISSGARIIGIRPVVDWECDDINSGVLKAQMCYPKEGKVAQVDVMLGMGANWWDAIIDLDTQEVVEIREYSYESGKVAEAGRVSAGGYALKPSQVDEVLGIVTSNQSAMALISDSAEVIGVRPVAEWECVSAGNDSGAQRLACHLAGDETNLADVMYGQRLIWWDVIVDIDLQEVVEVREYTCENTGSYSGSGSSNTSSGQSVDWETNQVKLKADDFYIEADGVRYIADVQSVDVGSDPGDSEYCTLELIWNEHGNEMRLNMYFRSDGTYWWADEIRTYNGKAIPDCDWICYTGEFFKTRLGNPFVGDIDLSSDWENSFPGRIHFKGLELQAFLDAD